MVVLIKAQGTIPEPIPTTLAMLLCDQVIVEAGSGKKTLVGVFDRMYAASVPFAYATGFSVFARLTDAEGRYTFKVDVVFLDEDRIIGGGSTEVVTAQDRLGFVDLVVRLPVMPFENYGKYEFQLHANDIYIGRTTLTVAPLAQAPKGS